MSYAQAREDLFLIQQFPPGFVGYAAEIGAYDGVTRSNTLLLEDHRWTVLCVEANPNVLPYLKKNRAFVQGVACGKEHKDGVTLHIHEDNQEAHTALKPIVTHKDWHPEKGARWSKAVVNMRTLDELLEQAEFPHLDALSIDVEGGERDVLEGCDLKRWNPKAVVIECWDADTHNEYMAEMGYKKVGRLLVNDCFVRE